MKVQTIVSSVAISLALVGAAQAQTPRGDTDNTPFQGVYGQSDHSSVTREQVVAELAQARAAGQTGNADSDNAPFTAQIDKPSTATAPVQADNSNPIGSLKFGDIDNQPFQG